jgi:outer membrane biosynthesis protein TonB
VSGQLLIRSGCHGTPEEAGNALAAARESWEAASAALASGPAGSPFSLAEPREGPDGSIEWHTQLDGYARELSGIGGQDRRDAEAALRAKASELASLGTSLSLSPDPSSKPAARLMSRLAAALAARSAGVTGPETIWVVGAVPVLAGWGVPRPAAPPAPPEPPDEATSRPSAFPVERFPAPAPGPPAGPAAREGEGPGALRVSLAALGAFLFAVLIFWLLSPGFRDTAAAVPEEDPAAGAGSERERGLRAELDGLKDRYLRTLSACRPEEPEPVDTSPPELPGPEAPEAVPPSAGDAPLPLEAAEPPPPPPEEEPEPEPEPAVDADQPPKPKPPVASAKAPAEPRNKAGGQLVIPKDAKDLGFLKGCWRSDAGMYDTINRMPIIYVYCFTESGGASVRVEEKNRGGAIRNVCTASGRATLSGGRVVIRDTGAKCPPGVAPYTPATVTCEQSSGRAASCYVQSDGGRRLTTRFTYQG